MYRAFIATILLDRLEGRTRININIIAEKGAPLPYYIDFKDKTKIFLCSRREPNVK